MKYKERQRLGQEEYITAMLLGEAPRGPHSLEDPHIPPVERAVKMTEQEEGALGWKKFSSNKKTVSTPLMF